MYVNAAVNVNSVALNWYLCLKHLLFTLLFYKYINLSCCWLCTDVLANNERAFCSTYCKWASDVHVRPIQPTALFVTWLLQTVSVYMSPCLGPSIVMVLCVSVDFWDCSSLCSSMCTASCPFLQFDHPCVFVCRDEDEDKQLFSKATEMLRWRLFRREEKRTSS